MTFPTLLFIFEVTFPIVLSVAGLVFLLIGLLGKIRIKDFDLGTDSRSIRVLASVLGIALLIAAFLIYRSDKSGRPEGTTENVRVPGPVINNSPTPLPTPIQTPPLSKPDTLIEIILREQRDNVRESYGESRGQNFSDVDLANFKKAGKVAAITDRLKTDSEFLDVVLAIKHMPPSDRQKLLRKGQSTFKPTWEQLGRIDRAGQTNGGQEAERMIAEGIVSLVKELSTRSDEEIKKLQS